VLAYLPIVVPEIVMGVGLLLFFVQVWRRLGGDVGPLPTVIAGHVAFSISYVMVVVRARLRDLDKSLEEAALDLGATPAQVWRRVTIPLLMPAIVSGALLVFTLSLDDFYVTYFSTTGGSGFQDAPPLSLCAGGAGGGAPTDERRCHSDAPGFVDPGRAGAHCPTPTPLTPTPLSLRGRGVGVRVKKIGYRGDRI
jgi:hypothetical protein